MEQNRTTLGIIGMLCYIIQIIKNGMLHDIKKRKVVFDQDVVMRKRVTKNGKKIFEDINLSD
jgi:hypothetical protein